VKYDSGMTKKIAVSLPDDLVAEAHAAVAAGRASSVSAYVAQAMRQVSGQDSLAALLQDLIEESGPPSEEDVAIARRVLYGDDAKPPTTRRSRRRGT
jgi:Arc/MetJ-type ribon-helix-helix transcriptional regulator